MISTIMEVMCHIDMLRRIECTEGFTVEAVLHAFERQPMVNRDDFLEHFFI
jgi:transcriptional regulator of met regulon